MRAIRIALFASLAASLAACGGSGSSKEPDAPPIQLDAAIDAPIDAPPETANLSCVGNAQPAAPTTVTLSGFAAEVVVSGGQPDIAPAHGALVQICKAASATCTNTDQLFTMTTDPSGCPATGCPWTSGALATGGTPLDAYGKVSKGTGQDANFTTYIYPPAPLTAGFMNAPGIMLTKAVLAGLAIAGIVTQDANKGILLIASTDCASVPLTSNTTLVVKQGGTAVAGTTDIDLGALDPTLAGTHAIFNVPVGPGTPATPAITEVSGTYKTTALRAHEVRVFPGGTTATQLRPGF
jgi:hypothetical protein